MSRVVAAAPDWTVPLARLESMGLVAFQANEAKNGWVFSCQLRTTESGKQHRIEAGPAATKAEAICLALSEAERWASGK